MGELDGRVALVTGASRGLGRGIAERLAREGAKVAVIDLKQPWAQATLDAIVAAGGQGIALAADVSDRETVHSAVAETVAALGGLDILVNNAMWNSYGPIDAITPATFKRMAGVGMAGVAWGIQAAAPAMRARGGGSIVTIGSMAGRLGMAGAMLYCGVKGAVDAMTRSASVELGPDGIRVNAVAPSTVATEGVRAILSEATFARRVADTPMRRLGEVEDIAEAVLWLVSDRSRFVTGQSIAVDGGIGHAFPR
ncbi:SDR family NAD(P)-dependent oxidoreductase [Sphingomonas sp. GB1N7]|uniref:SDR family NAD(P)-dependent oxidoreductase n=1 Tax=Parasphingomonas caseinilytica TaxID=3096158 RepID=UPI002FC6F116